MEKKIKRSHKHIIFAVIIFVAGAFLSIILWEKQKSNAKELIHEKFTQRVDTIKKDIQQSLYAYGWLLNGLGGLFDSSVSVTQQEWDDYVDNLKKFDKQYPEIASIGFSLSHPGKEIVYFSTSFERYTDNEVGLNLLNFPHRKEAVMRANASGLIELASQIMTVGKGTSAEKLPYCGLFKSIYKKNSAELYGHVFMEIDVNAMMVRIFGGEDKGVMLKISFKEAGGPDQTLYAMKDDNRQAFVRPLFSEIGSIEFNKTIWNIYFYSTLSLDSELDKIGPAIVFFSCILISFLGSIVMWSLSVSRERSDLLAVSHKEISMLNKDLEGKVKTRTKELERANNLLEKNNEFVVLKNELLSLMQGCSSVKEVLVLAGEFFKKIFPNNNGRIYFYNRHTLLLDLVSFWDDGNKKAPEVMRVSDCFALRYFHLYRVMGLKSEMICNHMLQENNESPYFCLPIVDSENIFGLINLDIPYDGQVHLKESIESIEKAISLTCVNLDLRGRLQYDAIHDPLTGLYNRRYFEESLIREIMKSHRVPVSFTVLMIDVDNFKNVNDKYGHQMGDEVLKSIANMLKYEVRATDVACRFGGEEFVVMMETSQEYAYKRAEQLCKDTAVLKFTVGNNTISGVTISIGLAVYPKHGNSMAQLIKNSDEALYKAKNLGKNRVVIFHQDSGTFF
jgi:diguanylate cyclase (GGDEF)-like protein